MDNGGAEVGYLYWLLDSVGGAAPAALAAGVYECWGDGQVADTSLRITGPGTYSDQGRPGQFRIEGSGQIVFQSGPLQPYHGKLLSAGRIGLSANGDRFFATNCELNRTLR